MLASSLLIAVLVSIGMGSIALLVMRNQGPTLAVRRWSEISSWIALGFGLALGLQVFAHPSSEVAGWFCFDELQGMLVPYILLMGVLVKRYAYNSLQTDPQYPRFFLKIKLLIGSLLLFVVSNHVVPLALSWVASGWVMHSLIAHTDTPAARHSAEIAGKAFRLGDWLVLGGLSIMVILTKSFYLTDWLPGLTSMSSHAGAFQFELGLTSGSSLLMMVALYLITLGAFSKTAQIPFQQWLPHTPAAPTPVSGIMHAGFVNSGAILLAKLSPLVVHQPAVMMLLFIVGLVSALWGSAAMLVQTDVKRYLTFSTVGQMGFMMMECGLGAFHLAILHLMVHGFFKARLFLSAGRVIEQRSSIRAVQAHQDHAVPSLLSSLKLGGAVSLSLLATGWLVGQVPVVQQTLGELPPILLITLAMGTLFTQTILIKVKGASIKGFAVAILFSLSLIGLYVAYDRLGSHFLPDLDLLRHGSQLAIVQWGTSIMLVLGGLAWLMHLHLLQLPKRLKQRCYVLLLNAAGTFPQNSTFSGRATPFSPPAAPQS